MTKILTSLTTYKNPDWRKSIEDLNKFGVREFAFFPTTIKTAEERMEIMRTIKKELGDVSIPFCHVRHDMAPLELDYLIENFGTKMFNTHPDSLFITDYDYSKYYKMTYLENAGPRLLNGISEKTLKEFAGICFDLSHLENCRKQKTPGYKNDLKLAEKYSIGMNHISAMTDDPMPVPEINGFSYERHILKDLSQVDYVKDYFPKYFGQYAAIETYNTIERQLEIKKYIEDLLGLH